MYLEKLKNELRIMEENLEKLENEEKDFNIDSEIIKIKRDMIILNYKIKREELFVNYRNRKSMVYHFVDADGSWVDVSLDANDINYDKAYKQSRNKILEDEAWDLMKFDQDNIVLSDEGIKKTSDYLALRIKNCVHIISDASISYLKENVDLIKKYINNKNISFKGHKLLDYMKIDNVLIKRNSDSFYVDGDVDEYESSNKVILAKKNDNISILKNVNDNADTDEDMQKGSEEDVQSLENGNGFDKRYDGSEIINLMKEDKYSDILKLIGAFGIPFFWKAISDSLNDKSVSKDEYNQLVGYLRNKTSSKKSFNSQLFGEDYEKIQSDFGLDNSLAIEGPKPVRRKKANKSLIEKFKGLSRGKKIAICVAGAIAAIGVGMIAAHTIPMLLDKINNTDQISNGLSSSNIKLVSDSASNIAQNVSASVRESAKNMVQNFGSNAGKAYSLVKESAPSFNTIHAGDEVFRSASDSIAGINGVSASGSFRDTVVAVFDSSAQKVIKLTPDNIDSVRHLLNDPSVPKAFGDSFTPGNVSGWKLGNGYKTIMDVVNMVGGKSL